MRAESSLVPAHGQDPPEEQKMQRKAGVSGFVVLAAFSAVSVTAGTAAVKKGTRGVIEVEYVVTGKGSQKVGGTDQADWGGTRSMSLKINLVAGDLQAKPVFIALAPVGAQSYAAKSTAVAQKHQDSMNRMQAEIAKCNHDESCEMRVSMQFMTSGEGAAMVGDVTRVAREASEGGPRYQQWSGLDATGKLIGATGTYKVDEYSKTVVYDPDCGKTNNYCTTVRETKGLGSVVFPSQFTQELQMGGVAVDDKLGLLTLALPGPCTFSVDVKEDVQSTQSGTRSRKLALPVLGTCADKLKLGVADQEIVLPLREERGETTVRLAKAIDGSPGTITIRWRFAVMP